MSKPIVAVVGRPNVGKSTLFNKLCGQRLAIVEDTPGITRDRIFANCEWNGHEFCWWTPAASSPRRPRAFWPICASRRRSLLTPPTASSWSRTCATA